MTYRRAMTAWIVTMACVALVPLNGCARFGAGNAHRDNGDTALVMGSGKSIDDELRAIVNNRIDQAERRQDSQRRDVIKAKPYFYKAYADYPEGPNEFEIILQETESRTTPYVADVIIHKQLFRTPMMRDRERARNTDSFLRYTGTETATYELRHNAWRRTGSMFLAGQVERFEDGQWIPVDPEADQTEWSEIPEQDQSWIRRVWSRVTGG